MQQELEEIERARLDKEAANRSARLKRELEEKRREEELLEKQRRERAEREEWVLQLQLDQVLTRFQYLRPRN